MPNLFVNLPVPTSNAAGAAVDVSEMGATKTIMVGGPFQGTVTIEYATDAAGTKFAPVPNGSFSSNPGRVTFDVAAHWMRAVMNGYRGGAANADVGSSGAGSSFVQLSAVPADISLLPRFKTVVVSGACNVEVSEDGITYSQAFSFQSAGGQSAIIYGQFARVTNGVTAWIGGAEEGDGAGSPPFNPSTITIYARTTGSDVTGDGQFTNPYRTFQRAVRDVPSIIPAGVQYIVDITGITETLPPSYILPSWKMPFDVEGNVNPAFVFSAGIMIQADLQPVVFAIPSDGIINGGDGVLTSDPITGLKTFTLTVPRASWVGLAGKMVQSPVGFFTAIIHDNPNTSTIRFTQNQALFPYTIAEPGATLNTSGSAPGLPFGGLNAINVDSIGFSGIRITTPTPFDIGLAVQGSGFLVAQDCELSNAILDTGAAAARCVRNWIRTSFENLGASANLFNSFVDAADLFMGTVPGVLNLRSSVFSACTAIQARAVGAGLFAPAPTSYLHMDRVLIRNGQEDGVTFFGSKGQFTNVDIFGCNGNGVVASDPGLLEMFNVGTSGAPNGVISGVGILVDSASQVRVNGATSGSVTPLTGAGGDMQVGAGATRTWADFVSGASGRPAFNEYDITAIAGVGGTFSDAAAAPAYATGTGSRLFQ